MSLSTWCADTQACIFAKQHAGVIVAHLRSDAFGSTFSKKVEKNPLKQTHYKKELCNFNVTEKKATSSASSPSEDASKQWPSHR